MRISKKEVNNLERFFNLQNYLGVGMLYLKNNPILNEELKLDDIKKKLVGHFGSQPGQAFIYTHLNRIIKKNNVNMFYISGPGHSGQVMLANSYIEGSLNEFYSGFENNSEGLIKLFKTFSYPGGFSSHASCEIPGSIHEGGELGYSLAHAFGSVLDNKNLVCACVIGDGEAETGALATSFHGIKFLNPNKDGVVLPILHVNGYKIANPTVFGRMDKKDTISYFSSLGYEPFIIDVRDRSDYHEHAASVMDEVFKKITKIIESNDNKNVKYPMIIFYSHKGWTGPINVYGKNVEGTHRSHQIPVVFKDNIKSDLIVLNNWLRSYKPEELFNTDGSIKKDILEFLPNKNKRMSYNQNTNGGLKLKKLKLPDYKNYKVNTLCGVTKAEDMKVLGEYIRDICKLNKNNFKIFGPDEAASNRLNYVFDYASKRWMLDINNDDDFLKNDGVVFDSFLSEHFMEGLLEGYLLTGRHGFIHSYEAFIRIIDSMVSQHAKWLKMSNEIKWREDIASLNIILTSHVWQQDHNGYTHQNPGFLNHLVTYKSDIIRLYFPIDANTLLSTFDHIIKSKNYINAVVASKHPSLQFLTMKEAAIHCKNGIGIFDYVSNKPSKPDIVLASCGDTPNLEIIRAATILKKYLPKLKFRVVNVIDLMRLVSSDKHPHGLNDNDFDYYFTKDKHVIFAFHGYPSLIHELVYNRCNKNFHVSGYNEEGTITTPFDMRVLNKIDGFNLVIKALKYVPDSKEKEECITYCENMLKKHKRYIKEHGIDMPEVTNFTL